jgi:hypothetical protein
MCRSGDGVIFANWVCSGRCLFINQISVRLSRTNRTDKQIMLRHHATKNDFDQARPHSNSKYREDRAAVDPRDPWPTSGPIGKLWGFRIQSVDNVCF